MCSWKAEFESRPGHSLTPFRLRSRTSKIPLGSTRSDRPSGRGMRNSSSTSLLSSAIVSGGVDECLQLHELHAEQRAFSGASLDAAPHRLSDMTSIPAPPEVLKEDEGWWWLHLRSTLGCGLMSQIYFRVDGWVLTFLLFVPHGAGGASEFGV